MNPALDRPAKTRAAQTHNLEHGDIVVYKKTAWKNQKSTPWRTGVVWNNDFNGNLLVFPTSTRPKLSGTQMLPRPTACHKPSTVKAWDYDKTEDKWVILADEVSRQECKWSGASVCDTVDYFKFLFSVIEPVRHLSYTELVEALGEGSAELVVLAKKMFDITNRFFFSKGSPNETATLINLRQECLERAVAKWPWARQEIFNLVWGHPYMPHLPEFSLNELHSLVEGNDKMTLADYFKAAAKHSTSEYGW